MTKSDPRLEPFMRRALELAERGGGATAPNPMVGCVLIDADGRVLGEGFHQRAGGPHAEAVAMAAAASQGHDVGGATAVVTLEPCVAHGRTPPCADALISAGVARVVYAAIDPHSGGGGARRLREAGVEVSGGLLAAEAERMNEAWLHWVATSRAFVHVKSAQTLNGMVTRGRIGPEWVTSAEARAEVHRMRRRHPAVMVGVGTLIADDPRLTARDAPAGWPDVQPVRVVLDTNLRAPPAARIFGTAGGPIWIFASADASADREAELTARGAEVIRVPMLRESLSLVDVFETLARRDVTGVLVEPGPTLATTLVEGDLVDRWTMFLAPDWNAAPGALPLLLSAAPHTAFGLLDAEWRTWGRDASVTGRFARPGSDPGAAPLPRTR